MTKEHIDKLLSGRFWLSIMTGIVFAYAVYAKILPEEAVAVIITMVFVSYFQRSDRSNGKEADKNESIEKEDRISTLA